VLLKPFVARPIWRMGDVERLLAEVAFSAACCRGVEATTSNGRARSPVTVDAQAIGRRRVQACVAAAPPPLGTAKHGDG